MSAFESGGAATGTLPGSVDALNEPLGVAPPPGAIGPITSVAPTVWRHLLNTCGRTIPRRFLRLDKSRRGIRSVGG